ncbi:MAG: hypothetical protein GF418_15290 [Chitinivibrionales bacterium]|nr:hypothetical protein [Chitinivibrionales bacterium]MBD3396986.1 hypothetical protein [Chitinivibrionales bacterium]
MNTGVDVVLVKTNADGSEAVVEGRVTGVSPVSPGLDITRVPPGFLVRTGA